MEEGIGEYLVANEEAAHERILAIRKRMMDLETELKTAQADHREAMRIRILFEMSHNP